MLGQLNTDKKETILNYCEERFGINRTIFDSTKSVVIDSQYQPVLAVKL